MYRPHRLLRDDGYDPLEGDPLEEAATARVVIDGNGVVSGWNEGACWLLDFPAAEIVGRRTEMLLVVEPAVLPDPGTTRLDGTVELRHRSGSTVVVWVLARRRQQELGDRSDWLVVSPLARPDPYPGDETLMRWVFAQPPNAVTTCDAHLRLRMVNQEMARVIGLSAERIVGLWLPEVGAKPQSEELEQRMYRVLTTRRREVVLMYMRTGGEDREHAWSAQNLPLADTEERVWGVYRSLSAARVREYGFHSVMSVPIRARRMALDLAAFSRHRYPEPFGGDNVLLAERVPARAAVCIGNARRFSCERETALALQRNLLPQKLARTRALAACRYACRKVWGGRRLVRCHSIVGHVRRHGRRRCGG